MSFHNWLVLLKVNFNYFRAFAWRVLFHGLTLQTRYVIKRSGISVKSYGVARWIRRIWATRYYSFIFIYYKNCIIINYILYIKILMKQFCSVPLHISLCKHLRVSYLKYEHQWTNSIIGSNRSLVRSWFVFIISYIYLY